MGAQVVSFLNWSRPAPAAVKADWSQQELAEFYRVENALIRAGLSIETDRGLSDEGDPWFVFLRAEDGEVVVHFARVDGEYLIAGPAYERVARGYDFHALVKAMIARHPLIQPQARGGNVLLHPAALLVAIVGTAFFKTGEAKAMESDRAAPRRAAPAAANPAAPSAAQDVHHVAVDANQAMAIMAGAMYAMEHRWNDRSNLTPTSAPVPHLEAGQAPHPADQIDFWSTGELKFEGLSAEASRAEALAQAPAILALSAVLDTVTIPQVVEFSSANVGSWQEMAQPTLSDSEGVSQSAPVYFDLQLRAGALPAVEAVQILREALGGGLEKIAVIAADKIPEVIAEIIAGGANLSAGAVALEPAAVTPELPPTDAQAPTPANEDAPGTPSSTAGHDPAPVTSTPPPAAPPIDAYRLMVQKVIDYFVSHVPAANVITSGLEVVFVDSRINTDASSLHFVDALTFHFTDGSSISLVGEHSTLYHELS